MSRSMRLLRGSLLAVALAILYNIYSMSNRSLLYNIYPKDNRVYDIFYLVEQWPATYCTMKTCPQPIPNRFTIHGLWPRNFSKWPHTNCCGKWDENRCKLNPTTINSNRRELNQAWPDLERKPQDKFWKHEWRCHGACSLPDVPQKEYFRNAISLYNTHNLTSVLGDAGMIESGKDYPIVDIKDTIWKKTKLKVLIRCQRSNDTAYYLLEIVLCVNHNANDFRDCNGSYDKDRCWGKKSVKFP